MRQRPRPLALVILDGWGCRAEREANAIALARTPFWNELNERFPHTRLEVSGERVGLPPGQMGNSEVGHLNIGAGRIVYQEITRIDRAIRTGEFFENPVLCEAMTGREYGVARASTAPVKMRAEQSESSATGRAAVKVANETASAGRTAGVERLHLMGLLSDGGVHSHLNHLFALLKMAKQRQVRHVFIHALLDGRDTPPTYGAQYLERLQEKIREIGIGEVVTVCGRYYAMDRDKRWDRTEKAYRVLVEADGVHATDPVAAVREFYSKEITDEFMMPMVIDSQREPSEAAHGQRSRIRSNDTVLFFNFRADRARQISRALNDPDFQAFSREQALEHLRFYTFTQYDEAFPFPVAFPPQTLENIFAKIAARVGLKNLRIAETEKYAHVTYFFNGGEETPFEGERRILIPSPKVPTYDLQPEMSALPLTDRFVAEVEAGIDDVVICNFANADMVGHTGVLEAAIQAVETLDACVHRIAKAVLARGGALLICSDHGNIEQMWDWENNQPHTAHTTNPVPVVLVEEGAPGALRDDGSLEDIAPTLLGLLGMEPPEEMTGKDLRDTGPSRP